MELVDINKGKKKSEHDQVWKGQPLHLDLMFYSDGVVAIYYQPVEFEPIPGHVIKQRHKLESAFVNFRWWHKIFGITQENCVDKAIRKLKAEWEETKQHNLRVEAFRERCGISAGEQHDG